MQSQIIEALEKSRSGPVDMAEIASVGFPKHYLDILERVGVQEIAADFVLPTSMHVAVENLRAAQRAQGWLVFAVSASSDMWLLRNDAADDQVAFLAQDEEAGRHPQPLGIGILQWFELAFFIRGHDAAVAKARSESEKRQMKAKAKKQLDAISPGLAQRYPYSL